MYCKAPHNSLVIQPSGHINLCCASRRAWNVGHISDIDDLYELWNTNPDIIKLRNEDESFIEKVCGYCLKNARNGMKNSWTFYNVPGSGPRSYANTDGKIRYLEFTTSNLCNQTCATCSSYYSSKWLPLEKEATEMSLDLESWKNPGERGFNDFDVPTYRMTDADLEKIMPLLPDLEILVVKGGEPFADNKNYHILKSLLEVNDKCVIEMTTNLSKLPQRYLDLFAGKNDYKAADEAGTGGHKEINRTNLSIEQINEGLQKEIVLKQLTLIRFRNTCNAFLGSIKVNSSSTNCIDISWSHEKEEALLFINLHSSELKVQHKSKQGVLSLIV